MIGGGVSLTPSPCLGLCVQPQCESFFLYLILYCFVVFDCCLLVACTFLKGNGRGMDLGERGSSRKL